MQEKIAYPSNFFKKILELICFITIFQYRTMELGDRIKEFAKHYGNASKLAAALDMTPGTLYHYTNSNRKPGADILLKLCELGCNINWLLTGKGSMLRVGAAAIANTEEKKAKKEKLTIEERMERLEKAVLALKKRE